MTKVPLLIVPRKLSSVLARHLMGLSSKLEILIPGLRYDLEQTNLEMNATEYLAHSLVNSLMILFLLSSLMSFVFKVGREFELKKSILFGTAIGIGFSLVYFFLLNKYPLIIAGKKAEQVDKNLIFGLKDLLMQINSGISLYNGIVNVSNAKYGIVSEEFKKVAKNVKTGMPLKNALEKMAIETKSEYLKRTVWQLVNTIKAGASLQGALNTVIRELVMGQRTKIKNYAQELNLWTLVYMLFAVAIPTIGSTMLVILSSFGGLGVEKATFISFITITFMIQIALIGFVKNRRPMVNF